MKGRLAALVVLAPWVALAEPRLAVVDPDLPAVDASPAGPSIDERLAEIARRVQDASHYPAIARERGAHGEALVEFEVGADGRATGVDLAESSGSGALDRAALRAVAEAAPLPFVYGRIRVPVRFTLDDATPGR